MDNKQIDANLVINKLANKISELEVQNAILEVQLTEKSDDNGEQNTQS